MGMSEGIRQWLRGVSGCRCGWVEVVRGAHQYSIPGGGRQHTGAPFTPLDT